MAFENTINIGLIQTIDTDFIVYDDTDRSVTASHIELDEITSLIVVFTGPELANSRIYEWDSTKKAKVMAYDDFEPVDCSGYLGSKTLTLNVNGTSVSAKFTGNYTNASNMESALESAFDTLDITFSVSGAKIIAETDTETGSNAYIQIVDGTLLDYINWNIGIHRGNDFSWGDSTVLQKDFRFPIYAEDFGYNDGEIPESYWNVSYTVASDDGIVSSTYVDSHMEFTYKQTEIYRAEMLEYISRNFTEFLNVEQRWQTEMELFMQKMIYFDAYYKSFLSSIDIGNTARAYSILNNIIDFKTLNPIS